MPAEQGAVEEERCGTQAGECEQGRSQRCDRGRPRWRTRLQAVSADPRQGEARGHYSAEIMSNIIGPQGGRLLVDRTVESLRALWPASR